MQSNHCSFDVVIMGGGPGGATLGALLKKRSPKLRVAIYDKERFPRDHIGESFAHPLIPCLEEAGSLAKVLNSECWIKKFGGIFNWDPAGPSITFFDHANWLRDGTKRWAMHVDRAEFDEILLRHAADMGVAVHEETEVKRFDSEPDHTVVTLADGSQVTAQIFVDASGRQNSILTRTRRKWMSEYRNVAIWNHYRGCIPAQRLKGAWNVFTEENLSPIGCFAFEYGWCWFIPILKLIDGKRELVHSIGVVTNPEALREFDLTDPGVFAEAIRTVPMLSTLVQEASAVAPRMHTATNYSMVNECFCNFDERWILVGDSAYFVDPLFSSGVAFAVAQAEASTLAILQRLEGHLPEPQVRELWRDYDWEWRAMAESYSLSIDQWYHHIAMSYPKSSYWKSRGTSLDLNIREQTFHALVDTHITPDLLQVMTRGSRRLDDLAASGTFISTRALALGSAPKDSDVITLRRNVRLVDGYTIDIPGFKAFRPPPPAELPPEVDAAIGQYWDDPVSHGPNLPSPLSEPLLCQRFVFEDRPEPQVRSIEQRDGGRALYELLKRGPIPFSEIKASATPPQLGVLTKLVRAAMVSVNDDGA